MSSGLAPLGPLKGKNQPSVILPRPPQFDASQWQETSREMLGPVEIVGALDRAVDAIHVFEKPEVCLTDGFVPVT